MVKIYIFSGDDTVSSRKAYTDQVEVFKKDYLTVYQPAKEIDSNVLENIFGSSDLFGKSRVLVTENLVSGPKSKNKDKLFETIVSLEKCLIVDWETKEISKIESAKFGQAVNIKNFKLPNLLFKFLDDLSPARISQNLQALHQITQTLDAGFVFAMLIRQVRLLLLAIGGEDASLPIWQRSKLKNQSKEFGQEKLLKIYHELLIIDFKQKTSSSPLDIAGELDLLIANL